MSATEALIIYFFGVLVQKIDKNNLQRQKLKKLQGVTKLSYQQTLAVTTIF